ncbi:hypothetical protein EV44_g3309 [Erysiphe necator]|uniref:Uncharacterized protein n=1 Tax=Uncinula necator TaxID=52586 RepID=A0A0B1PC14_UNCNE|nr:hypothetical protein EV44_g3309 [Erysiphe necator]
MKVDYILLSVCVNDYCFVNTNEIDKVPVNAQSDDTLNSARNICQLTSTSLYATCFDCRKQEHARHFPTVFEPLPIQRPSDYLEDVDVNEEKVDQIAAKIGLFDIEEEEVFNGPFPEEAPIWDDPIFLFSQLQSREFRNHDEIQRRLQADEGTNDLNHEDNIVPNDPFAEENVQIQINEIAQSQNLLPIDPFLESYPPPQAEI